MTDIERHVVGTVAVLTLNRPDRGNSVTPRVVDDLHDAVLTLTGTGSVFCAGADVQEMHAVWTADGQDGLMSYLGETWMPAVQRLSRALWSCPKPIVAGFNGSATAGGLDFGLTCDRRVAADTARFAESYVNLGMVPVAGGAFLLPLCVGLPAATEMLATGRFVGSEEALRRGLVDEVVAADDVLSAAVAASTSLAHGGVATFTRTKQIARARYDDAFDAALRESLRANVDLIATADVRRRILDVMERYSLRSTR
jgi:2-(1,2-epoxy-1,2-dihydrophenyl)acetyl-CoA isomerase